VVNIYLDKCERRDMIKIFSCSLTLYLLVLCSSIYLFPQAIYPLIMPDDHVSKHYDLKEDVYDAQPSNFPPMFTPELKE